MALLHPHDDLANRAPVWGAMSCFFIDTEISESIITYITRICVASPYSTKELEKILFAELWPAFSGNLFSIAGEWAGWSDDYVQKRVLESYKPRATLPWKWSLIKRFYCKAWGEVAQRIECYRNNLV